MRPRPEKNHRLEKRLAGFFDLTGFGGQYFEEL